MGVKIILKSKRVYISYTYAGERKLFAIKPAITCEQPELVDLENGLVYTLKMKPDKHQTKALQQYYNWFVQTVHRLESFEKKRATVSVVSRLYEREFINSKSNETDKSLEFDLNLDSYITYKQNVDNISGRSLQQYSSVFRKRLEGFLEANKYTSVEDINVVFLSKLNHHLSSKLKLSKASYAFTVATFKNFCKYLFLEKKLSSDMFQLIRLSLRVSTYENLTDFALTLEELAAFSKFDFKHKKQNKNRDAFVANCLTGGLRFSDFSRLTVSNCDFENKEITIYTKKTKKKVTIPMHSLVVEIIHRHNPDLTDKNKRLFNLGNRDCYNRSLKELAKKFYLLTDEGDKAYPYHEPVNRIIEKADKKTNVEVVPKYKLFKPSLCRRTFISVLAENYQISEIQQFTAHTSYTSLVKYIKVSKKRKLEVMTNAFGVMSI
ncbi:hypothetical protein GCM10027443_26500 [Pontibacter brevis]